jgi:hypothetical protein
LLEQHETIVIAIIARIAIISEDQTSPLHLLNPIR